MKVMLARQCGIAIIIKADRAGNSDIDRQILLKIDLLHGIFLRIIQRIYSSI